MKKTILTLIALVFGIAVQADTNTLTLTWTAFPAEEQVTHVKVYTLTMFPPGMPKTNSAPGEVMAWTPPQDQTNVWQLHSVVTNLAPDRSLLNVSTVTISNEWTKVRLPVFFTVTGANEDGEGPFSNVAWKAAAVGATQDLMLQRASQ